MHVNPGLSECFCLTLRSSVVGDERSNQPGIRLIDQKRGLVANLPPKGNGHQPGEAEAAGGFLGYAGGRPGTTHNDQIAGLFLAGAVIRSLALPAGRAFYLQLRPAPEMLFSGRGFSWGMWDGVSR